MPDQRDETEDGLFVEWRCTRCGVCCGATDGDPCEHLRFDGARYYCEIYEDRLGYHRTVGGHSFRCVTIKYLIETTGGPAGCAYVRELMRRRTSVNTDTGR